MKEFKIEVGKVRTLLSSLMLVWESNSHDVLALLLQNLAHDASDCHNYDVILEYKRAENILRALVALKEFTPSCPVTQFICEQIDCLYIGYIIHGENSIYKND